MHLLFTKKFFFMPYCEKCGAQLDNDALFCTKCGTKVVRTVPPPPPSTQEVTLTPSPSAPPPPPPSAQPPTSQPAKKKRGLVAVIAVAAVAVVAIIAVVVVMLVKSNNDEDEIVEYAGYMMSDQYKYDLKVMERAADLNSDMELLCLDFATNGFNEEIGDNTDEYFNENKKYYWTMLASIIHQTEAESEAMERSCNRLMEHQVFTSSLVVDENGEVSLIKYGENSTLSANASSNGFNPFNLIATPAYASPAAILPLLSQSVYNMSTTGKKVSRNSRRQTVTIAQGLSGRDLKKLFESLPEDEKFGETNHEQWWQNFSDGKYDKYAFDIYSSFVYGNQTDAAQRFQARAEDMGVDSRNEFMKVAKEYLKAGKDLSKDLNLTWLKVIAPPVGESFSTGFDYAADGVKAADAEEAYAKEVYKSLKEGKVVFDPVGRTFIFPRTEAENDRNDAIHSRMYDYLAEKGAAVQVGKFLKVPLDVVGGSELVEILQVSKDIAKEWIVGETDKPQIDWMEKMIPSTFVFKDEDTESPAVMAVLYNWKTGELITCDTKNEKGEFVIELYGDNKGDFIATLYDAKGDKESFLLKQPNEGETVVQTFKTDELDKWSAIDVAKDHSQRLQERLAEEIKKLDEDKDDELKQIWNDATGNTEKIERNIDQMSLDKEVLDSDIKKAEDFLRKKKAEQKKIEEEKAKEAEKKRADYEKWMKKEEEAERKRKEAENSWYKKIKEAVKKWFDDDDEEEEKTEEKGLMDKLGEKFTNFVQGKINEYIGGSSTSSSADDDDDDFGAPVVKDADQKEREKVSGMDNNFLLGRWKVKMTSAGHQYSQYPIPEGFIPEITVTFRPNGKWSGHTAAMHIAEGVTIPAYDTSGTYTFDGFNLKYGTGEVFVVTKLSNDKISLRDINSGAASTMTRSDND